MMKKIKVYLATILVLSFIVGTNVSAATVTVWLNQEWCTGFTISRSKNYSYAMSKCESVYPLTSGIKDTYTKLQVNLKNSSGTIIGKKTIVLTEGEGYSKIDIEEGYLNLSTVSGVYRGNDPDKSAKAEVYHYSP